ncbi:MAG TPA: hypothetical protein VLH39_02885 [Magnetospirillaceae bacterium]|nr:hypothetical protein [Magnetospirillaceae bacterium]
MPIKPIDLQTLFLQLNHVGKEQSAAKEGAVLQQSIQGVVQQKRREEEVRSVQKPEADEGASKVADREESTKPGHEEKGKQHGREPGGTGDLEVVKDPALGHRIDIQG